MKYARITQPLILATLLASNLQAQMPGAPSPSVLVEQVTTGKDLIERRSIGHIEGMREVLVRTAVEGYLLESHIKEGHPVKKGDLLIRIDDTRYRAALAQAQANIDELRAMIIYAEKRYERLNTLAGSQATSIQEANSAKAQLEEYKARQIEAEARLITAQKDLDDCTIRAEIDGQIGRNMSAVGNYVSKGQTLANIVQKDPIFVRFPLSQSDVLGIFGGPDKIGERAEIRLRTADGRDYPVLGKLSIVDNKLTDSTDTFTLWAEFPNPEHKLTPDGIAAVYVRLKNQDEVQIVPMTAVHYDSEGAFVYTLTPESNKVEKRSVQVGNVQGSLQSVYAGLKMGETVIIDGAHKTRPGASVKPIIDRNRKLTGFEGKTRDQLTDIVIEAQVAPVEEMSDPTIFVSHGARVESINTVEITPLVQGILAAPHFEQGKAVKKGQLLFEIDPVRYEAAVKAQKARVAQLEILTADAKDKYERQKQLLEAAASNSDEVESAHAAYLQLLAQIEAAKAALLIAEDDLKRCRIHAPMDGLMGRNSVTEGNYITDRSSLAQLIQISPIYVRFAMSATEILSAFGSPKKMRESTDITLITATGKRLDNKGNIAFSNNHLMSDTGTLDNWAIFQNKRGNIQPGAVVSIELRRKPELKVPCIPASALLADSMGDYCFVLGTDGRAYEVRLLTGTAGKDGSIPVYSGLHKGESVITNNQALLLNGSRIKPIR